MTPDENPREPHCETSAAPRGRPRRWESAHQRRQAHQQRRGERERRVTELLHAVRNAWWDEPELQQIINHGDDLEVLTALTGYYQGRHWRHGRPLVSPEATQTRESPDAEGAA